MTTLNLERLVEVLHQEADHAQKVHLESKSEPKLTSWLVASIILTALTEAIKASIEKT